MLVGFHMQNGFKTIKIEEVNVYGEKMWNFQFFVDNILYNERLCDDKSRYIKHLEKEYYFEEQDNFMEN